MEVSKLLLFFIYVHPQVVKTVVWIHADHLLRYTKHEVFLCLVHACPFACHATCWTSDFISDLVFVDADVLEVFHFSFYQVRVLLDAVIIEADCLVVVKHWWFAIFRLLQDLQHVPVIRTVNDNNRICNSMNVVIPVSCACDCDFKSQVAKCISYVSDFLCLFSVYPLHCRLLIAVFLIWLAPDAFANWPVISTCHAMVHINVYLHRQDTQKLKKMI